FLFSFLITAQTQAQIQIQTQNPLNRNKQIIDNNNNNKKEQQKKKFLARQKHVLLLCGRARATGAAGGEGRCGAVHKLRFTRRPRGVRQGPQTLLRPRLAAPGQRAAHALRQLRPLLPPFFSPPPPPLPAAPDVLRCQFCAREVDAEFNFCPFCGSAL
ncbi:hypothetical protein RJ639_045869, partial [Escallonia herrerae]